MLSTVDPRVTVEGRPLMDGGTKRKKSLLTFRCAACGERLAYSNDEESGVRLVVNNATARPCCDAWKDNT